MSVEPRIIRVSAPGRLDFAGAWTDVAPFATERRGIVVNAAIDLRTTVELRLGQREYHLRAEDLNEEIRAATVDHLPADGKLPLLKAAIRRSGFGPCSIHTSAEAPAGCGLGTSGALSVALVHAIKVAGSRPLDACETAHDAWTLETVDADVPGGQQDQYAAAIGGFQHLAFVFGTTTARSLEIDPEFARELAAHTVICYTGRSRFSGSTITRVMNAYVARDRVVVAALHAMADLAEEMAEAMTDADISRVASLLSANWEQQQALDAGMRTDEMASLERAMTDAGATGGKAAGAGAGGSMFFVVPGDITAAVAAARAAGAIVLPTRWADRGVSVDHDE